MFYNEKNSASIEKYSSAITLSDMEIFIFPELLYALVLANIMSPRIWKWREDPWFSKNDGLPLQKRIHRLKQFIMDHFSFNLDLDTWGLTTKQTELARFKSYIDTSVLAESNALFGYEGDKYYFDIDIRKHFGLDKYRSDIIPYWKTETVEAMEAFKLKPNYPTGAGECVSLATLYAAAAFIISGIPLDDIYLYATPLHSQNFLDVKEGILTNNRRIVTKSMWFNGTELSAKARRALENEKVTVVAHHTGYIHTLYSQATIDQSHYHKFGSALSGFLTTPVTFEILANFLRQNKSLQGCFQISHNCCGKPRFIEAEKVYSYEHSSKSRIGDHTQNDLLHEIEEDEFYTQPIGNRLLFNEIESFFKGQSLPADAKTTSEKLKKFLQNSCECYNVDAVVHDLLHFCRTQPRLPSGEKEWLTGNLPLNLDGIKSPEEAVERLDKLRSKNPMVDLAFAAYRDLTRSPWKPFLKAAFERNPVSVSACANLSLDDVYRKISTFSSQSIYNGDTRLSQPDEVWNYTSGDGLECALCFMNILKNKLSVTDITLEQDDNSTISVKGPAFRYQFKTAKKCPLPQKDDFSFGPP